MTAQDVNFISNHSLSSNTLWGENIDAPVTVMVSFFFLLNIENRYRVGGLSLFLQCVHLDAPLFSALLYIKMLKIYNPNIHLYEFFYMTFCCIVLYCIVFYFKHTHTCDIQSIRAQAPDLSRRDFPWTGHPFVLITLALLKHIKQY